MKDRVLIFVPLMKVRVNIRYDNCRYKHLNLPVLVYSYLYKTGICNWSGS